MAGDLHPTPTRLALLRRIQDRGDVYQYLDVDGLPVSIAGNWRRVTARCAEMRGARWIVLDEESVGPLEKRRWLVDVAGRAVLDAHPEGS